MGELGVGKDGVGTNPIDKWRTSPHRIPANVPSKLDGKVSKASHVDRDLPVDAPSVPTDTNLTIEPDGQVVVETTLPSPAVWDLGEDDAEQLKEKLLSKPQNSSQVAKTKATVEFNQEEIHSVEEKSNTKSGKKLEKFWIRFDGWCELICNRILLDKAMDRDDFDNYLKNSVTRSTLSEEKVLKSHIVDNYSFFAKIKALIFGKYPSNIFTDSEQKELLPLSKDECYANSEVKKRTINKKILQNGLSKIENGQILKLSVFSKSISRQGISFSGHSLLVRKVDENKFEFFDPNKGLYKDLNIEDLCSLVDEHLVEWNGTDVLFTSGEEYVNRLEKKRSMIGIFKRQLRPDS